MRFSVFFTLSIVFLTWLAGFSATAQILGPSIEEVKFSYRTSFQVAASSTDVPSDEELTRLAEFHASHIFGIFASPKLVRELVGRSSEIGGIGAPRSQWRLNVLTAQIREGFLTITYSNSGKMVLHQNAARELLEVGALTLPLPQNPYAIYDVNCTDEYYNTRGDYWYFYDPYRRGCEYLSRAPKANPVEVRITQHEYKKLDLTPKLPVLRGNNGNGDKFKIYLINGYDGDGSDQQDLGYESFAGIRAGFEERDFTVKSERRAGSTRPQNTYTKTIYLDNGQKMDVEVHHLLVDTGIEAQSAVFARFFKKAVEEADVVVYGGHSGLGANLDIPSLEAKAGAFNFNPNKKQIFFFDSCSSYSYYLQHFAVEKTKAKIDILSYGLSSYFHTSNAVLFALMDRLLSESAQDVPWMTIMEEMEAPLEGDSYLLNVGGI